MGFPDASSGGTDRGRGPTRARAGKGKGKGKKPKLPSSKDLESELKAIFKRQREIILQWLDSLKAVTITDPPDLRLGTVEMAKRCVPMLTGYWDAGRANLRVDLDLDPESVVVRSPEMLRAIQEAALDFCDETNATTTRSITKALDETRRAISEGAISEGESRSQISNRIMEIFDQAERWRADRIARTEMVRGFHQGKEFHAFQTGGVAGWEFVLSDSTCPLCKAVRERSPRVRLGAAFAFIGDHPTYSEIRFPPVHPHCRCTLKSILDPDLGGPDNPEWSTPWRPTPQEIAEIMATED